MPKRGIKKQFVLKTITEEFLHCRSEYFYRSILTTLQGTKMGYFGMLQGWIVALPASTGANRVVGEVTQSQLEVDPPDGKENRNMKTVAQWRHASAITQNMRS